MRYLRFRVPLVVAALFICACKPVNAQIWHGGYRVSLDGYVVPSLSAWEYLSIAATFDPLPWSCVRPALHAGALLPSFPWEGEKPIASLGLSLTLCTVQDHPFDRFLRSDSALTPKIDIAWHVGSQLQNIVLLTQPWTLDFGEKQVGMLGFHAVYDLNDHKWGWGLRLFEIAHYTW